MVNEQLLGAVQNLKLTPGFTGYKMVTWVCTSCYFSVYIAEVLKKLLQTSDGRRWPAMAGVLEAAFSRANFKAFLFLAYSENLRVKNPMVCPYVFFWCSLTDPKTCKSTPSARDLPAKHESFIGGRTWLSLGETRRISSASLKTNRKSTNLLIY